jgi:hypothetical protein
MSIDLASEHSLSLSAASRSRLLVRDSRAIDVATVWRWVTRGVRGPDGECVKLEACKVGGFWITSREALERFIEKLTSRVEGVQPVPRSPAARMRASERAAKQLEKLGI